MTTRYWLTVGRQPERRVTKAEWDEARKLAPDDRRDPQHFTTPFGYYRGRVDYGDDE